ncbi:hypothetical protein [Streptomyces roseolus]|uniref:hypothetical protein n=1 Tax=Streptomyces roseolus TaxID=67358 RepID=UPI0037882E92
MLWGAPRAEGARAMGIALRSVLPVPPGLPAVHVHNETGDDPHLYPLVVRLERDRAVA